MNEPVYSLLTAPVASDLFRLLAVATLIGALGVAGVAVVARGPKPRVGERRSDWDMLFETLRDLFAVTALYVAADLLYYGYETAMSYAQLAGAADLTAPLISAALRLVLTIAIAVISLRRILALGAWLTARRAADARRARHKSRHARRLRSL